MTGSLWSALTLALLAAAIGVDEPAVNQEKVDESADAASTARLATIRAAAKSYTLRQDGELALQPEPLLRFDDPITKASQGAVYVWTDKMQRPAVMASIYFQADGARVDEFLSLFGRGASAEIGGEIVWSPMEPNIELKRIMDGEELAKTAPLRLAQMRSLIRKYSASVSDRRAGRQELRLLPQPIYRYSQPEHGLVDGAVFAFAKGTNPEVLLIMQAEAQPAGPEWRLGWARMTSRECEVREADTVIWSAPYSRYPQGINEVYFNRSLRE